MTDDDTIEVVFEPIPMAWVRLLAKFTGPSSEIAVDE